MNLPDGPTFHFKITSVKLMKQVENHGSPTDHDPELILNHFNTRMESSLFLFPSSMLQFLLALCSRSIAIRIGPHSRPDVCIHVSSEARLQGEKSCHLS